MSSPAPSARVYLDYNATAPMLSDALERMMAAARERPGNASSPHAYGQAARAALEANRARIAAALGFGRRELWFTSGGSEGNNQALRWLAELPRPVHLITTPIEHPSVLRTVEWLERQGVAVSRLPVDGQGCVAPEALGKLVRPETRMVSVMAANNETGALQPLAALGAALRNAEGPGRILFHSDAVQAFGRVALDFSAWGVDACTVTAHKLGGPKGIGALACREEAPIPALVLGGAQERGRRAGTESVFLAEGFGAAVEWIIAHGESLNARLAKLRDDLIARLQGEEGFFLNAAGAPRLPNTLNGGFAGVPAQGLLTALDLDGIAISSGSACSSGAIEPSHVLQAMGLPRERVACSLRISLGHGTSEEDVARCGEAIRWHARRIREQGRVRRRAAV